MIHKIGINCFNLMEILENAVENDILFNVDDSIWDAIQTNELITIVSHQNYMNVFFAN